MGVNSLAGAMPAGQESKSVQTGDVSRAAFVPAITRNQSVPGGELTASPILERGVTEVHPAFDLFELGVYCVNLHGFFTYVNRAAEALLGWDPGQLLGRHAHDTIHHSRPDGSPFPRDECPFYQAVQGARSERTEEDVFWRSDGSRVHVSHSIAPLYDEGDHVGAIVVFADVGDRHRATELLHVRAAQQAALAELGLVALGGDALHELFQYASVEVARMLDVEFSEVLELIDREQGLRLVGGMGWSPATVTVDCDSQAGFVLASDRPVVVSDWRTETRFRAPRLLREHGVICGAKVVIHRRGGQSGTEPWGVLGAHTRSRRTFTAEDIDFLQAVANTLALAIERRDAERELRQRNVDLTRLAEQVSRLADDRRQIMADALDADDRTREQISQLLHDEVLQSLLVARQDLARATPSEGAGEAVRQAGEAIRQAIGELRNAVAALHPVTLAQGGLAAAIRATAEVHARWGGFEVTLDDGAAVGGARDQLIISVARELLGNVAQHAHAGHVTISLQRAGDEVILEVVDDGRGMDPGRPAEAFERGHVGLASIAMRAEACDGRFEVTSQPGEGTRARLALPAAAE